MRSYSVFDIAADNVLPGMSERDSNPTEDGSAFYWPVPKNVSAEVMLEEALMFSSAIERCLRLSMLDPHDWEAYEKVWLRCRGTRIHLVADDGEVVERNGKWLLRAFVWLDYARR